MVFNAVFIENLQNALTSALFIVFLVLMLGYLIGRINIKGVELGSSGVFIIALIVGVLIAEFGGKLGFDWGSETKQRYYVQAVRDIGLAMFVAGIGFIAGPTFIRNFKSKAIGFLGMGITVIVTGTLLCLLLLLIDSTMEAYQGAGLLMGAMSSTPGLSAAREVFKDKSTEVAALSGLAYPFGVLGVVLFVQLMPRILRADINKEVEKLQQVGLKKKTEAVSADKAVDGAEKAAVSADKAVDGAEKAVVSAEPKVERKLFKVDAIGICVFSLAVMVGMLVGAITIPLGGKFSFSLGTTGGALIAGLLFAHFGKIGRFSLQVPKPTLSALRELGLVFFLAASGIEGGFSFLNQFKPIYLLYGAIMTTVPMIVAFIVGRKLFKLELLNNLGSLCGGMTSTPALGALIHVSKTEDVAQSYAATYPISLFLLIFVPQIIAILFG